MYNEELIIELGRKVKSGETTWSKATEEYNLAMNDNRTAEGIRWKYNSLKDVI